nr:solute carrier family 22 [Hymenolepis microstoma]
MHGTQIDELFENHIGGLGLWQLLIIFMISISFSNSAILSVFFNAIPKHRCRVDEANENQLKDWNFTDVAHLIGPVDTSNNQFRQCSRYSSEFPSNSTIFGSYLYKNARNLNVLEYSCPNGYAYEYRSEQYKFGIVQQWDLVCDKAWQVPFNESAYMIGMMVGFILGGWMSDRIGRRKVMLICGCAEFAASLFTALSLNHWFYIFGRTIVATFTTARGSTYVVLITEITTAKLRTILFAIGMILQVLLQGSMLTLLAQNVNSWRLFMFLNSSPSILSLVQFWLLPESPRWLAACDRVEEARHVLYSAYRFNTKLRKSSNNSVMTKQELLSQVGINIDDENSHLQFHFISHESAGGEFSIWRLFKPGLLRVTLLATFILTCQITCTFGIIFFASNIKIHVSLVVIVNSLAQIPGNILAAVLYKCSPSRKIPLLTVYAVIILMLSVAAFQTMFFKPSTDTILNVFGNIIILFLIATQRMVFIYVPELYKPIYRNRGFGIASGLARLTAMWYPQINRLDEIVMHGFPLVIYALVLVLQLVFLVFLDDTTGKSRRSTTVIRMEELEGSQPQTSNETES